MYNQISIPNNTIRSDKMNIKKRKTKEIDENSIKFEIASELGLADKIREEGWAGLTAKESGKIGGIMTSRKKKAQKSITKNNVEDS